MNQEERNDQLQKENTTLRGKVAELQTRVDSLSDSVLMAAEVISAKENEVAELTGALEEANLEINRLRSEVKELRVA